MRLSGQRREAPLYPTGRRNTTAVVIFAPTPSNGAAAPERGNVHLITLSGDRKDAHLSQEVVEERGVRLRQGTRRPIGEGIAVPLLGHGVVVGQELPQHRISGPAETLHAAQEVGVCDLDTLAHGAGAGLPDLEKIKD